ncbi:MAG: FGGY family carbohydrate kinase [Thermoguttaceae bacterium]|jgi:xylulokinase|nr:FGGY family carbohydrate kinase [Thermoguttaceae bacterium]
MYLGLDLGTTNVKAVVADRSGRIVADGSCPIARQVLPGGGVEQDIEETWSATLAALRQAAEAVPGRGPVEAVGVSSQGGTMQWLDGEDRPAGPVISWMDGRGRAYDEQLDRELGEAFFTEHAGRGASALTPGQVLRLREERPGWMSQAEQLGFVGDVIVGRLCGRRAHDATSLSIAMLLNPRLGRADSDLLARLGLSAQQLPDLLPATTAAGLLLAEVAAQTALPAGIPVSPAVHDQYAATIGVGSVRGGDVCLGTGTAWVLLANVAGLSPPATRETFVCPHPVGEIPVGEIKGTVPFSRREGPASKMDRACAAKIGTVPSGLYGQMLSMGNGGSALQWAMALLRQEDLSGEALDAMLESVPPGAGGLCFWPLLSPRPAGAAGLADGGRLAGLRLDHGAPEVLRAVVEGLACELNRHLHMLVHAGVPVGRLLMCGTAAASRVTPRILADLTRCPVLCGPEAPVSAIGASVIGRAMVECLPLGELALELAEQRMPELHALEPCADDLYGELVSRYNEPFGRL